jgi:hypothetical protein
VARNFHAISIIGLDVALCQPEAGVIKVARMGQDRAREIQTNPKAHTKLDQREALEGVGEQWYTKLLEALGSTYPVEQNGLS